MYTERPGKVSMIASLKTEGSLQTCQMRGLKLEISLYY